MRLQKGWIGIYLGMVLVVSGCSEELLFCTEEFRQYTLLVVDAQGNPVEGVTLSVTNKSSGEVYLVNNDEDGFLGAGVYVIMDDLFTDQLGESETVVVIGSKGEASFTEEFVFSSDDCHVNKISGVDEVVLD